MSTHQLHGNVYVTACCQNPLHTLAQFIQEWFNCLLYVVVTRGPVATLYAGDTQRWFMSWIWTQMSVCGGVCVCGCRGVWTKRCINKFWTVCSAGDDAVAATGFILRMQRAFGVLGKEGKYGAWQGPNTIQLTHVPLLVKTAAVMNANWQTWVYTRRERRIVGQTKHTFCKTLKHILYVIIKYATNREVTQNTTHANEIKHKYKPVTTTEVLQASQGAS